MTISSACSRIASRTRLNQAFSLLVIMRSWGQVCDRRFSTQRRKSPIADLTPYDDTETLRLVRALDVPQHPAIGVRHRLGCGSGAVSDLPGPRAGDPRWD